MHRELVMNKFGGGLDYAGFLAIKQQLTESLAKGFEKKLIEMGDLARGISWFSTDACSYAASFDRKAA